MIDLHSHTLLSDGVLLPAELAQRAKVFGYRALAITDHVDASNIEYVIKSLKTFIDGFQSTDGFTLLPGVELTHIPPAQIGDMTTLARSLGAGIIICHGETIVEPVAVGTNRAAIEAGVDILAHPGLITQEDCELASARGVSLEITSRRGHCLSNGRVASMAKKFNCTMVLNTDSHAPGDLITMDMAKRVAYGAGLTDTDIRSIFDNAQTLLKTTAV